MTTIIEKVLQLQDIEIFRFARTEHLSQLASVSQDMNLEEGFPLFRLGETCKTFHILVEGQVGLESKSGTSQVVQRCALDYWSFLANGRHLYSATCQSECLLYTVSYEEMVDLLTAEPEFCWAIIRHLAEVGRRAEIGSSLEDQQLTTDR
ncbi:MAG: Crp/Fnr family transcriptional regulator [bacterium]